jgi:uncharacterized membrane protein YagU involved in acid resistance
VSARDTLVSFFRGQTAGAIGTLAMTAWQELAGRLRSWGEADAGGPPASDPEARWQQAPAPAKVARLIGERVLHRQVSADLIPLLTNVMHWGYGIGWGGAYGLLPASAEFRSGARRGAAFGAFVWAMSYVELVPLGLYEPPWRYPAQELAFDLSYHLVYGTSTGLALKTLDRA